MSNCRGEQTRERILESGMNVLMTDGAANVSLRQVATAAGLTPMAIYRHFDDKESLELALLDHAFTVFEGYLKENTPRQTAAQSLTSLAGRFFDFALERESHFRFLFLSNVRPVSGAEKTIVRSLSGPTFLLLKEALQSWAKEVEVEIKDLNALTIDVLAFCVGQVALRISGNLSYTPGQAKPHMMRAFERYLICLSHG